jgi:hypothetical protein
MDGEQKIRDIIGALYSAAGMGKTFNGQVRPELAELLGRIMEDLASTSRDFSWLPTPPDQSASVDWFARNVSPTVIARLADIRSSNAIGDVVHRWSGRLEEIGRGA